MKSHQKHSNLNKRRFGQFGVNEIAILGTNCNQIDTVANSLRQHFQQPWQTAYIDASHSSELNSPEIDTFTYHSSGHLNLTGNIPKNRYNDKIRLSSYDLVLINGNHFKGDKQIILLDPNKEASVKKRLEQLSDVLCFVRTTSDVEVFDCLKQHLPQIEDIPIFNWDETESISELVEQHLRQKTPALNGLVLAGGKSVRMGTDKGLLSYGETPQRTATKQLLESAGIETFLSLRADQEAEITNRINDTFLGLGPLGAICSAFQKNPNVAWLVMATDIPFVDLSVIKELITQRDPSKIATALKGVQKEFPEPLLTIWEPKAYPILLQYMAIGLSCPRKVIINNPVKVVEVDDRIIQNINTPEEFQKAKSLLNE